RPAHASDRLHLRAWAKTLPPFPLRESSRRGRDFCPSPRRRSAPRPSASKENRLEPPGHPCVPTLLAETNPQSRCAHKIAPKSPLPLLREDLGRLARLDS